MAYEITVCFKIDDTLAPNNTSFRLSMPHTISIWGTSDLRNLNLLETTVFHKVSKECLSLEAKIRIFNAKRCFSGSPSVLLRKILSMEITLKLSEPWGNGSCHWFKRKSEIYSQEGEFQWLLVGDVCYDVTCFGYNYFHVDSLSWGF